MTKKRITYVLMGLIPMVVGIGISYFFDKDIKADVYLLYDHSRYLDNIFYDVSNLLTFTVFSYFSKKYNAVLSPFFYISLLQWVLYFTIYKQFASYISLPILVGLLIYKIIKK